MPENTSGYFVHPGDIGNVRIAEEVIVTIVSNTINEIEGVAGLDNPIAESLASILGRRVVPSAIKVTPAEGSMAVDIALKVKYGYIIKDLCREIQKKVTDAIESMTGLKVSQVNIQVSGVSFDYEKRSCGESGNLGANDSNDRANPADAPESEGAFSRQPAPADNFSVNTPQGENL